MTDMTVAKTVLDQLGGARFVAVTGAKNLAGTEDSLSFQIGRNPKRVTHVRVTLTPADTYAVTFFRTGKAPVMETDIYCDQLEDIFFEHTGLHTSQRPTGPIKMVRERALVGACVVHGQLESESPTCVTYRDRHGEEKWIDTKIWPVHAEPCKHCHDYVATLSKAS